MTNIKKDLSTYLQFLRRKISISLGLSVARPNFGRRHLARLASYLENRERPLRGDVVLYEAFNGRGLLCNPYAIFQYLLDNPGYSALTHVWALRADVPKPGGYKGRANVLFVPYGSKAHFRCLATAGYIISNNTLPPEVVLRPGQRYLNTYHGTPLKAMGRDMPGPVFLPQGDLPRDLLQATHCIAPNEYTLKTLLDTSEITPFFSGRSAIIGQPRVDLLLNMSEEGKARRHHDLGLPEGRPVLLYAPTFRAPSGAAVDVRVDLKRLKADLEVLVAAWPGPVLFKGHHTTAKDLKNRALPVHLVPFQMEAAEVLAVTDLLVTDYSSIFFDFLPARRPIIFYQYDLEDYEARRGPLYFRPEELPGPVCNRREDLMALLSVIQSNRPFNPGPVYLDFLARYAGCEDGQASQRAADFFFNSELAPELGAAGGPRRLLLHLGPWPPDAPAAAFLNQLAAEPLADVEILLAVDDDHFPDWTKVDPARWRINGLGFFPRRGGRLEQAGGEARKNLGLEFRRLFGQAKFDLLACRAEAGPFWPALFQAAPGPEPRLSLPGRDPAAWRENLREFLRNSESRMV